MDTLSMKRYELPPPPAGKMTDIAAWNECVENSLAQLEHQATRLFFTFVFFYSPSYCWCLYFVLLVQRIHYINVPHFKVKWYWIEYKVNNGH